MKTDPEKVRAWQKRSKPLRSRNSVWSKKDKSCEFCGVAFVARNSFVRHCSRECCYRNWPKNPKEFTCEVCEKKFTDLPSRPRRFCSRQCNGKAIFKGKIQRTCHGCGVTFEVNPSALVHNVSKYCSLKCFNGNVQKKKKTRKQSHLKRRLWKVFSLYIRMRDRGECISCEHKGNWQHMDAGHYIPRTAGLSVYFDERNVNAQCVSCNRFRHGNLSSYAMGLVDKYGEDILQELNSKKVEIKKYSKLEYLEMFEHYKCEFLKMGGPENLVKNL